MSEPEHTDLPAAALLLSHIRRIVIGEILKALSRDESQRVVSLAVQRLVQYLDEGPVQSIAGFVNEEQFRATIDRVIEELQANLRERGAID